MKQVPQMMRCAVLIVTALVSSPILGAGHDLTPAPPTVNQIMPVVTGRGAGFLAAWSELTTEHRSSVVSQPVSAAGEPAGSSTAIGQRFIYSLATARGQSDALVVGSDGNIFAERLSPSGFPINTILLESGDYPPDIAVAWNGSRYFVVWAYGWQLIGAFVASDGSTTVPKPFLTIPSYPSRSVTLPDVAWDGRHFIVVFTEQPNLICYNECHTADPDAFGVMRVSADGDAIDKPIYVKGRYARAHVASSGADSLIVLDRFGDVWAAEHLHSSGAVSAIAVHDDGSLKLDAEMPLFAWRSDVSSAVAWDGVTYTVAWRYIDSDSTGTSGPSWMGAARVTPSGGPFDYRFTATGDWLPYGTPWARPSIAVNDAGVTAFVVSEGTGKWSITRARLYLASELAPMPPPPPAPRNVSGFFDGKISRADWQSEAAVRFVVEYSRDSGRSWIFSGIVAGDLRTTTVYYATAGDQVRVRAVGPGGLSEGTVATIMTPRRRAERR